MSAPRFFVDVECAAGAQIELRHDDAHHAIEVLRMHTGDPLVIVRDGTAWDATLSDSGRGRASAQLIAPRGESGGELPVAVTVLQAIAKGSKFDEVVEKAVELGARRIVPVVCERSYAEASSAKIERWRRIARSAAQQSRRRYLPEVGDPMTWMEALRATNVDRPTLVAYERASPGSFDAVVDRIGEARSIAIAIGPEGGLTDAEVAAAKESGGALVSLGPTILRTETAAPAMLAALAARCGWW
ncbi:MAG TPA: 16S rRNA (uracil(1498)-N(3))-methyltransferase [Candidatus Eremiobacteraceae bacterium]|jgi:16S rRNA (uracil1498-N3)-methyltransferase|nr:16S rRNA (uracil(1498)-N(3))-methyltransferase [Candidatus Eremiobacteraceae bacterium]